MKTLIRPLIAVILLSIVTAGYANGNLTRFIIKGAISQGVIIGLGSPKGAISTKLDIPLQSNRTHEVDIEIPATYAFIGSYLLFSINHKQFFLGHCATEGGQPLRIALFNDEVSKDWAKPIASSPIVGSNKNGWGLYPRNSYSLTFDADTQKFSLEEITDTQK